MQTAGSQSAHTETNVAQQKIASPTCTMFLPNFDRHLIPPEFTGIQRFEREF
jgi:hypothetical protein